MRTLLLFLPCLLLCACNSQEKTSPTVPNPQAATQGTLLDWQGDKGTVNLMSNGKILSTASVDNKGKFTLPLPDEATIGDLGKAAGTFPEFPEGCVNNQQVSDSSSRLFVIDKLQVNSKTINGDISSIEVVKATGIDATVLTQNYLIYASRPTQIYGDVVCSSNGLRSTYTFLLDFTKGWNMVQLKQSQFTNQILNATTQFSTVALTGYSTWRKSSLRPLSLP